MRGMGKFSSGAAFWGRQIEVGMLRNNYKMSNVSDRYPVAKSYQDHQGSQSEVLRTFVKFWSGDSVSS